MLLVQEHNHQQPRPGGHPSRGDDLAPLGGLHCPPLDSAGARGLRLAYELRWRRAVSACRWPVGRVTVSSPGRGRAFDASR
jgi:hypothetical protein